MGRGERHGLVALQSLILSLEMGVRAEWDS